MARKKIILIISVFVVFVISMILFVLQQKELSVKYNEALAYAEKGDYENALDVISQIGEYQDSEELFTEYSNEIKYKKVKEYIEENDYDSALPLLTELNSIGQGFKDSLDLQYQVEYKYAVNLEMNGKLEDAFIAFRNLPTAYMDVADRLNEITYARKFIDKWYCKEHQIDMEIKGYISEDNVTHLNVEIRDRNGFLLGDETNKLYGNDLILMEDRFVWDMFDNGVRYAVLLEDDKLKFAKQPVKDDDFIVSFVRKLNSYNEVDGNINSAVDADVDAGVK
ncbi:MAG: hypothetical protein J6N52_04740 [Clostridia bacterium]|nr:hypothetical protein [Clostridia bacterium]